MRHPLAIAYLIGISVSLPGLVWAGDASDPMEVAANRSDYIARSGATVPKPDKLGTNESSEIQRRTPDQIRDDAITRGICVGCTR
ncbi:hypothetical protein ACRAWG_06515 [Methylobacterium sp. P31]